MAIYDVNFAEIGQMRMVPVMSILFTLAFFAFYAGLVTAGAAKTQSMELRGWGIAASIMAMVPITTSGVATVVMLLVSLVLRMVMDDMVFVDRVVSGVGLLFLLAGLGAGIFGLITFNQEEVIAGFEYEPEG